MLENLTIIIMTYNEEQHIQRSIGYAHQLTRNVHVVDSMSSDRTCEIAEQCGATVWKKDTMIFAEKFNWAIHELPVKTDWVMRLDADEIMDDVLVASIRSKLEHADPSCSGICVKRYPRFLGKLIKHGNSPQWQIRLWRQGHATMEKRRVDENMVLKQGRLDRIEGKLIDDNLMSISIWVYKHNINSTSEAIVLLNSKYCFLPDEQDSEENLFIDARIRRWLKRNVYSRFPRGLRPFLYFAYRMTLQLGILDGFAGFHFHFLQGFWYRYLVDVKIGEVERIMRTRRVDCAEAVKIVFGSITKLGG